MSERIKFEDFAAGLAPIVSSDRRCLIYSGEHGVWWRDRYTGYTLDRSEAGRYSVRDALAAVDGVGPEKRIYLDLLPELDAAVRSSRREVRNPVLALPSVAALKMLDRPSRMALRAVLADLAVDAAARAQSSWKSNKAPMAAYWKAVSVYAKHVKAVLA